MFYKFKCGDVVQVNGDESLPCDLLILYAKSDDRKCYVTTANLDGETNFKVK
jgi:phospholipid-translocating ATPase